ncbi:hypothetical protein MOSE0_J02718 [Monosporozyma servazzii]
MSIVKVCGLQSLKDAQCAVSNGATHIGVICVPNRKRTIPTDEALRISEWVHNQEGNRSVKLVGVFQNQSIDQVKDISEQYNLDVVQLHGDEDWEEYYNTIKKPIIKRCVFPQDCNKVLEINKLENALICTPLFDSAMGGTGELLNWDHIDIWAREQENNKAKFILAGGLTPLNVNEAFSIYGVIGVDVSGGVETDGIKDHNKIKTFIEKAFSS